MNALVSPIDKNKLNPSWIRIFIEIAIVPMATTTFELLLVGFATFFPTHLFEIEHPIIIGCQIITVSTTVAFFQGCRSWGYLSYLGKSIDTFKKYYWLSGALVVIPLNLLVMLYFTLYSQNPAIDPANANHIQLLAVLLTGLNFAVGIWGSKKQYLTIKQNLSKGPMQFFFLAVGFSLAFWFMIFGVTSFISR